MKKFVYCISLLSAVFCTAAIAQNEQPYNILKIEGMVPVQDGETTYFIKNVGTGLYVSYGGEWGKHCKESRAAHPFTLETNSDGTVALQSLAGYLESATLWMDWGIETSKWTLQPVGGEYVNQYYLVGDNGRALTSVGNSAGMLSMTPLGNKASQRWIFLTEAEVRSRMLKATADKPFDATPLIKGAAFDLVDVETYLGESWTNFDANKKLDPWHCGVWTDNAIDYNYCGIINGGTNTLTITHTVTLPAGTYSYSFEGFYEYAKIVTEQDQTKSSVTSGWANSGEERTISRTDNGTMTATVSINGTKHTLQSYGDTAVYEPNYVSSTNAAEEFRDNDTYKQNGTFYLASEQPVSIVINKGNGTTATTTSNIVTGQGSQSLGFISIPYDNARTVTTTSYPNQIFIDDFTLLYFGNEQLAEDEIDEGALQDSYVDANIDEIVDNMFPDATEEEKEQLKEEIKETVNENAGTGNSSSDLSGIVADVENTVNDIQQEQEQEEALGNTPTNEDGEITDEDGNTIPDATADRGMFIKNPSFEEATWNGWTVENGQSYSTFIRDNNIAEFTTIGVHEGYLFHAGTDGVRLTQTITGLPNGVYKMTVSLASDAGNTAILIGGDNEHEVTLTAGKDSDGKYIFEDFDVKFRVTDGTATIGVVGNNWYRADNFRLVLLNDHLVLSETDEGIIGGNQLRTIDHWYGKLTLYRTIKANGNWNTFVVPFDIPASSLTDWEVKELIASETDEDGDITLTFSDAEDGIKAGVPYMVRNTKGEGFNELTMQDVSVNATPNDVETEHVAFRGVWTKGYVPIGSFFISSNTFYRSVNETNRDNLKGYRAYIEPLETNESNARSLGYRFASRDEVEEGTTTIDTQASTEEITIVAIYTLDGTRISEIQQGMNILQMSNGNVVKVIIK